MNLKVASRFRSAQGSILVFTVVVTALVGISLASYLTLVKSQIDLPSLINSVFTLLLPLCSDKDVNFTLDIHKNIPKHVICDAGRLRQVLMNFTSNALKFTHLGFVKLIVSVIKFEEDSCEIQISIIDSGIGMPDHLLKSINKQFALTYDTDHEQSHTAGVTLSISCAIIKLMQGALKISSSMGQGSDFTFTLTLDLPHQKHLLNTQNIPDCKPSQSLPS